MLARVGSSRLQDHSAEPPAASIVCPRKRWRCFEIDVYIGSKNVEWSNCSDELSQGGASAVKGCAFDPSIEGQRAECSPHVEKTFIPV